MELHCVHSWPAAELCIEEHQPWSITGKSAATLMDDHAVFVVAPILSSTSNNWHLALLVQPLAAPQCMHTLSTVYR